MDVTVQIPAKKQKIDYTSSRISAQRVRQQHSQSPESLPLHSHSQSSALNPPNAYRQPLPNSPYPHNNEPPSRVVPQQPPHGGFAHSQPPVNTQLPSRDSRPLTDQSTPYATRNNSTSGPIRSPDGHSLRPINTSFEEDTQHYTQHPNPDIGDPAPSYTPSEPPPHGGFAPPHGLPMNQAPHEIGHGPQHPAAITPYGEPEMVHNPSGQQPYHPSNYGPPVTPTTAHPSWRPPYQGHPNQQPTGPRKAARATQACDICRARKAKCDEGKPRCGYCKETGQNCVYKDVAPPKADRAQKEIMDQLMRNQDHMQKLDHNVSEIYTMLSTMVAAQSGARSRPVSRATELDHTIPKHEPMYVNGSPRGPTTPKAADAGIVSDDQTMYDNEREESTSGELATKSIAVDHSTGVHRLLRWPNIQSLLESSVVKGYVRRPLNEDFVMQLEISKGVLRLYGRGQGQDKYDGGSTTPASPATSTTSTSRSDDSVRSPAASPPDIWGANIGPPNMVDGKFSNNSTNDHPGGLNPNGTLKIDKMTMDSLLKSYMDNIHVLHPFLDKSRLRRMFDKFYSQSHPGEQHTPLKSQYLNSITNPDPVVRSKKRKHSTDDSPQGLPFESIKSGPEPLVERRISTAIVLLVMALGKICAHKEFLPGPVPDLSREHSHGQHTSSPFQHSSPSLTSTSRVSSPTTSNMPDGRSAANTLRTMDQTPMDVPWKGGDRNVDVIPGLAYYTKATEILGALQGGIDLANVQAHLLASLYMGQLACSIESWSWIESACRSCLFLMRSNKLADMKDEVRKNLIYFAYWTCFQFEGDILAELDLKSSGLENYTMTPYPQSVKQVEDSLNAVPSRYPDEDENMFFYSAQIMMRSTLNKIQSKLYPPNLQIHSISRSTLIENRNQCLGSLADWRRILPRSLQWEDGDPPANNILAARLRAKYWGTLYIITRPLLNYAIHYGQTYPNGSSNPADHSPYPSIMEDTDVIKTCEMCIWAAKQSTTAFDNIVFENGKPKNRLIVTNIFGTAHAQFGNILVLAAAYRSQVGSLVDREEFIGLLNRTIVFLTKLSPISETLRTDANILRGVLAEVEPPSFSHTASFSSN